MTKAEDTTNRMRTRRDGDSPAQDEQLRTLIGAMRTLGHFAENRWQRGLRTLIGAMRTGMKVQFEVTNWALRTLIGAMRTWIRNRAPRITNSLRTLIGAMRTSSCRDGASAPSSGCEPS